MTFLLRLMLTEEYRMHTSYTSRTMFLAFPALVFLLSFATAAAAPNYLAVTPLPQMMLVLHVSIFLYGVSVGAFGFLGRQYQERATGNRNCLVTQPSLLPMSFKRTFLGMYVRDAVFYLVLILVPLTAGLFASIPISHFRATSILLLFGAALITFLAGMSLSFFMSTLYVRSVPAFAGISGAVAALFLGFAAFKVVPATVLLPGLAVQYAVPPLAAPTVAALLDAVAGVGLILLLIGGALVLVTDQYEPKGVRAEDELPGLDARLAGLRRYGTLLAKELLDLKRSRTPVKMFFSYVTPLVFLSFTVWFVRYGLAFPIGFNTVFYAAMVGFFGISLYNWLNNVDAMDYMSTLPLTVPQIIRVKLLAFLVLTLGIGAAFVVAISWMNGDTRLLWLALPVMVVTALYSVVMTAYLTGLRTNSFLFDPGVLFAFSAMSMLPDIGLAILSFTIDARLRVRRGGDRPDPRAPRARNACPLPGHRPQVGAGGVRGMTPPPSRGDKPASRKLHAPEGHAMPGHGMRRILGRGGRTLLAQALALVVLSGGLFGAVVLLTPSARAATLFVGGVGPGNYTTIQGAVDAANPGDTVFVFSGVYHEQVTVPKTLSLVGENRDATVIDGQHLGNVVSVTASWVNVTGFTVTNSTGGAGEAAIKFVGVQHGRIAGNNVSDNWGSGISLFASTDTSVEDNVLGDNLDPDGAGILLDTSAGNRVANNTASGGADGVRLLYSNRNVVTGNHASGNWDYGVFLGRSWGNRVENNSCSDNWGRGVVVARSDGNVVRNNTLARDYGGVELELSSDNLVTENLLNHSYDAAVYLSSSSGNRVSRNAFVDTFAISVLADHALYDVIDNNTFRGSREADVDLWSSVGLTIADNTMARGIVVTYISLISTDLSDWNTHDIRGNLVDGRPVVYWKNVTGGVVPAGAAQVILANATGVAVTDQSFDGVVVGVEAGFSNGTAIANVSGRDNVYGVVLASSRDSVVENASFANASQMAVYLRLSDANVIANSSFRGASFNAVRLESSFRNAIRFVNASGGATAALDLEDSGDNLVAGSTFVGTTGTGANLRASGNNTLSGCTFADNTRDGLYLTGSDRNTIVESWIEGNGGVGVNVTSSVGNRVYHNNIVGNARQAVDDRANAWNDSYPSGGNYWSDYAGTDAFHGPNQDIAGSDGIGDTPYVIDADSADRYPLMTPLPLGQGRPPPPPAVRAARLAGTGLADVEVSWDLSADDGGGERDVAGYEVWSGPAYDPTGASYTRLASVPAGTTSFVHAGAGYGDLGTYFYQVRAVEQGSGRTGVAPVQAAKGAGTLPGGWALLSIPFRQSNVSVAAALQTLAFDVVRTYRASDPADPWKAYYPGGTGDLVEMQLGDGLWVHVTSPGALAVAGLVVPSPAFLLRPGWNLVGYNAPVPRTRAASLAGVPGVGRVETFDPLTSDPYRLRPMGPGEVLYPGGAYWIFIEGAGGWWVQG